MVFYVESKKTNHVYDIEELERKYCKKFQFFHEGCQIYPIESPWALDAETDFCKAIDSDGNDYIITWDIKNHPLEDENQEDTCDWSNYKVQCE